MRYVFFDIECANCFDGKGKICSFGYVITDENFQVLQKEDWLMNPRSRFYLAGRKGDDIELAYPQSEFRRSPTFPAYYEQIRDLLTAQDQIVVGHAVSNDVKFLMDECRRYQLPHFDYAFYDTQKVYREFKEIRNQVSLDHILEDFGIEPTCLHKSDDDALMTMWSAKALCQAKNLTLPELFATYPACAGQAQGGVILLSDARRYSDGTTNRLRNANLRMFLGYLDALNKISPTIDCPALAGKSLLFPRTYEAEHFRQMVWICQQLALRGASYTAIRKEASLIVTMQEARSYRYINFEDLLSLLQIDPQVLEEGKIDVDAIFASVKAKPRPAPKRKRRPQMKKKSAACGDTASEGTQDPLLASAGAVTD